MQPTPQVRLDVSRARRGRYGAVQRVAVGLLAGASALLLTASTCSGSALPDSSAPRDSQLQGGEPHVAPRGGDPGLPPVPAPVVDPDEDDDDLLIPEPPRDAQPEPSEPGEPDETGEPDEDQPGGEGR